ncbi:MAG: hypothetical protein AB1486_05880 [Planctomycetota bacterium]
MRSGIVLLIMSLSVFVGPVGAQKWFDDFDSYAPGPLAAQSDWEEWPGSSGVDATVVTAPAPIFSTPNSVLIEGGLPGDDVVYNFANLAGGQPRTGQWIMSIKTFVDSDATGTGYFIMLNRFPNFMNWSVQVRFDSDADALVSDGAGNPSLPLLEDQWVTFRVAIDLPRDRVDMFYGDQMLVTGESWKNGLGGNGIQRMAALDLYAGELDGDPVGTSGMWWDDATLWDDTGASSNRAVVLDALPNPVTAGQVLKLTTMAPELGGQSAALFTWSVNGIPFVKPIFYFSLDWSGRFQLPGPVPPGFAGLDVEFIAYVALPGGGVAASPPELVKLR